MIADLTGYDGREVVCKWRRGKRDENKGMFKPVRIADKRGNFGPDSVLQLHCTLFVKGKAGSYEEKLVQFILETTEGKKIGTGLIDLALYADLNGETVEMVTELLAKNKVPKACLLINISSTPSTSTGDSEETENFLISEDEQKDVHGIVMNQLKEKEEREEAENLKQQMRSGETDKKKKYTQQEVDALVAKKIEELDELISDRKAQINEAQGDDVEERSKQLEAEEQRIMNAIKEASTSVTELTSNITRLEKAIEDVENNDIDVDLSQINEEVNSLTNAITSESYDTQQADLIYPLIGDTTQHLIKLLNTTSELAQDELIVRFSVVFNKRIIPFVESCLFSVRSVFDYNTSDVEQISSGMILNEIESVKQQLKNSELKEELQERLIKQIFHYLTYFIVDTLLQQPNNITCSKGFQIKFFMSYMDVLVAEKYHDLQNDYTQFGLITDIANLLLLHQCLKVTDFEQVFHLISIDLVYALLKRFQTDEMNDVGVSKELLEEVEKQCTQQEIPTRMTLIA
ncbi:C2 NT-type domain-containing protein [Entamoeba marina]